MDSDVCFQEDRSDQVDMHMALVGFVLVDKYPVLPCSFVLGNSTLLCSFQLVVLDLLWGSIVQLDLNIKRIISMIGSSIRLSEGN